MTTINWPFEMTAINRKSVTLDRGGFDEVCRQSLIMVAEDRDLSVGEQGRLVRAIVGEIAGTSEADQKKRDVAFWSACQVLARLITEVSHSQKKDVTWSIVLEWVFDADIMSDAISSAVLVALAPPDAKQPQSAGRRLYRDTMCLLHFVAMADDAGMQALKTSVKGVIAALPSVSQDAVAEAARRLGRWVHAYRMEHCKKTEFERRHAELTKYYREHIGVSGQPTDSDFYAFWRLTGSRGQLPKFRTVVAHFRAYQDHLDSEAVNSAVRNATDVHVVGARIGPDPFSTLDQQPTLQTRNPLADMAVDENPLDLFDRLPKTPNMLKGSEINATRAVLEWGAYASQHPLTIMRILVHGPVHESLLSLEKRQKPIASVPAPKSDYLNKSEKYRELGAHVHNLLLKAGALLLKDNDKRSFDAPKPIKRKGFDRSDDELTAIFLEVMDDLVAINGRLLEWNHALSTLNTRGELPVQYANDRSDFQTAYQERFVQTPETMAMSHRDGERYGR